MLDAFTTSGDKLDLLVLGLIASSISHRDLSVNVLEAMSRASRTSWGSVIALSTREEGAYLVPEWSRFQEPLDLDDGKWRWT
jgi:hypothetical protein